MLSFPIASSTEMHKQGSESWSMDEQVKTNYYFLLCKECYWCASSVNLVNNRIIKCPSCNDACIKLIPIFKNETYRIGYSEKCGSTTEFQIKYTEEFCGGLKNKVY